MPTSTVKMSAVEFLISFVNARLSAAVDEIFTVFENTIVKYEQDIARQRRLLESFWKPEVKLRRIGKNRSRSPEPESTQRKNVGAALKPGTRLRSAAGA